MESHESQQCESGVEVAWIRGRTMGRVCVFGSYLGNQVQDHAQERPVPRPFPEAEGPLRGQVNNHVKILPQQLEPAFML